MTKFRTPEGKPGWFCTTSFVPLRQHLTLDFLATGSETACGHPVDRWSNQPIRTPIGMTCHRCVRNITKHGEHRPSPFIRVMRAITWPLGWWLGRHETPPTKPETISVDELFPSYMEDED